jgi:hypothetical protein
MLSFLESASMSFWSTPWAAQSLKRRAFGSSATMFSLVNAGLTVERGGTAHDGLAAKTMSRPDGSDGPVAATGSRRLKRAVGIGAAPKHRDNKPARDQPPFPRALRWRRSLARSVRSSQMIHRNVHCTVCVSADMAKLSASRSRASPMRIQNCRNHLKHGGYPTQETSTNVFSIEIKREVVSAGRASDQSASKRRTRNRSGALEDVRVQNDPHTSELSNKDDHERSPQMGRPPSFLQIGLTAPIPLLSLPLRRSRLSGGHLVDLARPDLRQKPFRLHFFLQRLVEQCCGLRHA